jgi:hypothetical protein
MYRNYIHPQNGGCALKCLIKLISFFAAHLDESLKRKRIKTSGKKGSYKVCSKKRLCNKQTLEAGSARVKIVDEDVGTSRQEMHASVKLVPYSRHVDARCVEQPPFSISVHYSYMDCYRIEPKFKAIMKDGGAHFQRYSSRQN